MHVADDLAAAEGGQLHEHGRADDHAAQLLDELMRGVVVGTAELMELTALGGREVVGDVHTVFTA